MMADNNNSTQTDDNIVDSSTEDQMLADILNKSEILQEAGVVPRQEESQPEPELEYSEDIGTEEDLEEPVESAEYEDDVEPDNEEEEDSRRRC